MKNLNTVSRVVPLALFSVLVVAGCSSTPDPGNTFSRSSSAELSGKVKFVVSMLPAIRNFPSGSTASACADSLPLVIRSSSGRTQPSPPKLVSRLPATL